MTHSDSTDTAATPSPFAQLGLNDELCAAIASCGYTEPTPIQRLALPLALEGRDVLGQAETGTGKTGSYLWPMIQKLSGMERAKAPRGLVLVPTRELAAQVYESFLRYKGAAKLRAVPVVGGADIEQQAQELRQGCDVVIATPGRLTDQVLAGAVNLERVRVAVLDEADRMLELGFYTPTRRLLRAVDVVRQTLFFSATLHDKVEEWADSVLLNPVRVEATRPGSLVTSVREAALRLSPTVKAAAIRTVLMGAKLVHDSGDAVVIGKGGAPRTLIFLNHRRAVDALSGWLVGQGIAAAALHGGRDQAKRAEALRRFRDGAVAVLIATDLAARGLELPGIDLVIHGEMATEPFDYIHRSGRTARMGKDGLTLSLVSDEEVPLLRAVEETTGRTVPLAAIDGFDLGGEHPPVLRAGFLPRKAPSKKAGTGKGKSNSAQAKALASPDRAGKSKPQAKSSRASEGSEWVIESKAKGEGEGKARPPGKVRAKQKAKAARASNPSQGGKFKVKRSGAGKKPSGGRAGGGKSRPGSRGRR